MNTDVAIVGGGPGGTAAALSLAQLGIQATIVEKHRFPRYHIGESMTGECGAAMRALGLEPALVEKQYPVKHGVRVFGPDGKNSFWVPVMKRTDEGLVPATTWQVPRAEFDELMLKATVGRGVQHVEARATAPIVEDGVVRGIHIEKDGQSSEIRSKYVIDASGMATFLSGAGILSEKKRGNYDNQIAIFSQVKDCVRDTDDNTLIFYRSKNHWAWFIPITPDVVSVGVVVSSEYFKKAGETPETFFLREVAELNPELVRRAAGRPLAEDVRTVSNYSYQIDDFTGPGFLCVGDSHRFIDPVFSFGVHFAVKEGQFAATAIDDILSGRVSEAEALAHFKTLACRGMDAIQDLLDAFWDHPLPFAYMVHAKYVDDFRDMFAGRVYGEEPPAGLVEMRRMNAKMREKKAQASA